MDFVELILLEKRIKNSKYFHPSDNELINYVNSTKEFYNNVIIGKFVPKIKGIIKIKAKGTFIIQVKDEMGNVVSTLSATNLSENSVSFQVEKRKTYSIIAINPSGFGWSTIENLGIYADILEKGLFEYTIGG